MATDNAGQEGKGAEQPGTQQRTEPPSSAMQPPPNASGSANGSSGDRRNREITFLEGVGNIVLANLGPILTVVVIVVGIFGVGYLIRGNDALHDIRDVEYARGIITVLFSVGTIAIAIVLILSAIFLNDPEKKDRFDRGKEVLSLLLGIFGTIVGFYYGANVQKAATDRSPAGAAVRPAVESAAEEAKKVEPANKAKEVPAADTQKSVEPQKGVNQ